MLKVIRKRQELQDHLKTLSGTRGLVPTMGHLHEGHLSLLESSLLSCEHSILTIFVNPLQFSKGEDLDAYPKTLEQDTSLTDDLFQSLQKTGKVSKSLTLFAPESDQEVFSSSMETMITLPELARPLCGQNRPGHFDGVATVIYKLFKMISPHKAFFGLKDYQQYLIIKQLEKDLELDVEVIGLPTVRNEHGLALSSRNHYLDAKQMEKVRVLPQTLQKMAELFVEHPFPRALSLALKERESALGDSKWHYLEIYDAQNLRGLHEDSKQVLIAGAYKEGLARLIDNRVVDREKNSVLP